MPSLDAVRARFARNEGLPFADVLTEANILDVLNEQGVIANWATSSPSNSARPPAVIRSRGQSGVHWRCADDHGREDCHRGSSARPDGRVLPWP